MGIATATPSSRCGGASWEHEQLTPTPRQSPDIATGVPLKRDGEPGASLPGEGGVPGSLFRRGGGHLQDRGLWGGWSADGMRVVQEGDGRHG